MAYIYKDDDLTHINIKGKDYKTGYSQNNYDDDEKVLVHGAKQEAEYDIEQENLLNHINSKDTELENSITNETAARADTDTKLQNQINSIVMKNATVYVSADPYAIYKGVSTKVKITATVSGLDADVKADTIMVIKRNGVEIARAEKTFSVLTEPTINQQETYEGVVMYRGLEKSRSVTVYAEHPVYVGVGKTSDEAVANGKRSARPNPKGSYPVTTKNGDRVYIMFPSTMNGSFNPDNVFVGSNNMGLTKQSDKTISGVNYTVYQSDVYGADSFIVDIK